MKTLHLIAVATTLLTSSWANASAPTSDGAVDWALDLARAGEQQLAYYCTTTCTPTYGGGMRCTQTCF
jgi:hypothetical protein